MDYTQVEQRTEEWRKQRVGRITGSIAGGVLGLSPWQTPESILRQMVRAYHGAPSEFVTNPAVEHGTKHERHAMLCFMRKTGLHVEDVGFLPLGETMGASPDGLTDDGGVLELKTPFSCRNGAPFKPLAEQPHYYAQCQFEACAAGREFGYFAQYRAPKGDPFSPDYVPEEMMVERFELDHAWWTANMEALNAFYERYLSELDNPAHLAPLRVRIDTDEAQHIVNRIGEIDDALHNLTEERKAHLEKLVQMADGKDADIWGRKLTRTKDSTSVAYAKAIKELAPNADLAKWTTVKQGYWRLS